MLSSVMRRHVHNAAARRFNVAVVGAAGGIGAPLSLLLKQNPLIGRLSLYDLAKVTPGVGMDLSHINTAAKIVSYTGNDLAFALKDADVVVVPAGMARKPGMTRDDLFSTNAGIVANIAAQVGQSAPNAILLIISNPVNSTVPICAEVLKKAGVYNKNKLFGVTSLDIVRANTFVAEKQGLDVASVNVPVVCGHSGATIIPLLSQVTGIKLSQADREAVVGHIQTAGDQVVKAKDGGGSATLSMAWAGAYFTNAVLRGLNGEKDVVECTFVESDIQEGLSFFSSRVTLGVNGVEKIHPIGEVDDFEREKMIASLPELKASIQKGIDFVKNQSKF